MKILHVYKTFINDTMGGVEQVIAQLGAPSPTSLSEHTVVSLSPNASGSEIGLGGIQNIRYKEQVNIASNAMSWELLRHFKRIASEFDLIHYHFPWPFADMLHLMSRIHQPSMVTYHSDIVRQKKWLYLYEPMMHRFLRSVQAVVATSPQYLASSQVLQRYQHKTRVIPIGIDGTRYPEPSAQRMTYWQTRFGPRFFLFVGVMRYYKGLSVLLDAMVDSDMPLVIAGAGPLEDDLKAQAKRLNLGSVHFVGKVSEEDKIALQQLSYAFVFPSILRSEAFGVSLLEAAMWGKPLISTELGTGTSYINVHEQTGLVIPPNDPKALREAMAFLWEHPIEADRMGQEAARRHQALFTAQQMIASYENLYQEILSEYKVVLDAQ